MEFNTGRLDGLSRIKEYPSDRGGQDQKRRARARGNEAAPPNNEDDLGPPEEDEIHRLDDRV